MYKEADLKGLHPYAVLPYVIGPPLFVGSAVRLIRALLKGRAEGKTAWGVLVEHESELAIMLVMLGGAAVILLFRIPWRW